MAIMNLVLPEATDGTGALTYSLSPTVPGGLSFDANTRMLTGTPMAFAPTTQYTYTVTDSGNPAKTATLTFTITVNAEEVPTFVAAIEHQTYTKDSSIEDLMLPMATGGTGALTYTLLPALPNGLSFDADTRMLTGTPDTVASTTQYTYTVTDASSNEASLTFTITVIEPDTTAPVFSVSTLDDQVYTLNTVIADLVLPTATDSGALTYTLTPPVPSGLSFDAGTRTLSGTPDTEQVATVYTYTATDASSNEASLTFTITVIEPDTTAPVFPVSTLDDQVYTLNTVIAELILPTATDSGALTYTLTPPVPSGLSFDASTRTLRGTPDTAEDATEYTYTATDASGNGESLMFTITVNAEGTPTFAGSIGHQTYTKDSSIEDLMLPMATGGTGALTYTLLPALPNGLSFDTDTRMLTGTPDTVASTTQYTYTVTDASSNEASLTFTITVIEADTTNPVFSVSTLDDLTYTMNTVIADLVLPAATDSGALTYTLIPALPSGLSFAAGTRTLSGTPDTAKDTTDYTYTATDASGNEESLTFTITVNAEGTPTFAGSIGHQTYTKDSSIEDLMLPMATGGTGALTYTLLPALPNGLSFDTDTRMLTGTPDTVASTTQYTYTVTDASSNEASLTFTITVIEPDTTAPVFPVSTLDDQVYTLNTVIAELILPAATDSGPLTYTLTPPLPSGLSLAAGRTLSGTPDTPQGVTEYTYKATDTSGNEASLTFTITVNAAGTFEAVGRDIVVGVYPNPSGDTLHVELPFGGFYKISVLTLTGQAALGERQVGGGSRTLDVSSLTRGVYVLRVEHSEGLLQTFRIIR